MNDDFREFLHIIFKRKRFVALAFLLIALPIVAVTLLRPSQFQAKAKLLLVGNRSYLQLAPQDTKRTTTIPDAQVLNAEVENLKNWSFLLSAADRLDIEIIDPVPPDREERNRVTARAIRSGLEVMPYPTSPMIEVAFTDHDKNKAAAVANTVVDTYLEYRPNIFESPAIGRFYARRAERLQQELRASERKLERYQRKTGIMALQQQRDEAVRQLMAGQLAREETDAQIRQTQELIESLEEAQQSQPEKIAGDVEMVDNPVARALEERIGILTVELSDLRQKYTDEDRRVQDKTTQIAELRREVGRQPRRIIGAERFELNPVRQNLSEELYRAHANVDALAGKRISLDGTIVELEQRLTSFNQSAIRYEQLEDRVESKRGELQATEKRGQEANLSLEMTAGGLDSIRIVDRAQPPLRPHNQNTGLAILVALIAGLGLGVAGAFGLEFLYRTYHFAADIEGELEIPVLGLISDFHGTSGQLAR
jgi:polysaccharide biosynthesis transport protein